jgi:hypothetical protein
MCMARMLAGANTIFEFLRPQAQFFNLKRGNEQKQK